MLSKAAKSLLYETFFSRVFARILMLVCSALAALFGLLGAFFQKEFIDILTGQDLYLLKIIPSFEKMLAGNSFSFLILSFFCILLSFSLYQVVIYVGAREAIILQRKWSQRIYEKILSLRPDSLGGRQVGEIVSIYTIDIQGATILLEQSMPQAFGILFPLILAPIMIVTLFNTPILPTILIMSGIIVLNLILATRQSRFFYQFKKLAAERLGLVNEWIQNIRTLRILNWVESFEKKIFAVRNVETRNRISMLVNGQSMNAIASSVTFVLTVILISSFISSHANKITAGALLILLWMVTIFLTRPFRQMPWFFTFVFDGLSSLNRAATLFELDNFDFVKRHADFQKLKDLGAPDPAIAIKNLNLNINGNHILKNINFAVGQGEFVAIVGEVGAGKSMMLYSLLGETCCEFDEYKIGENETKNLPLPQLRQFFTFVPQEGFIMSANLRENIAFEYHFGKDHDEAILKSLSRAQFGLQQERLTDGLDTEIGERGVNLSGGQKQRVSLARVDYYQAPIVLLDDCLSAVDVDTERLLVQNLINGAWRERTRILVTHRLTVLERVDRIFFMENGAIIDSGKFADLLSRNPKFREFTATIVRENVNRDKVNPETQTKEPEILPNSTHGGGEK